jgi:hypothetical protein
MTNIKKYFIYALIVIVLLAVGYAFGRFTTPNKVVTQTVTKIQTQTVVQFKDRIVTKVVYVKAKQTALAKDIVTTTTKKKNGEVTTVTHEHEQYDTSTQIAKNTDITKTDVNKVNTTTDTQTISTKVIENSKPDWQLHVLGGIDLTHSFNPIFGGEVDRRILGPIFVGAWGLSNGSAGLSLSLEL